MPILRRFHILATKANISLVNIALMIVCGFLEWIEFLYLANRARTIVLVKSII